jgi:tRNA-guanine family transglycosylase
MFVPPLGNIVLRFMRDKSRDIDGRSYVSWWMDNSVVKYNKVLAAMPYFKDTNLYDDFSIPKNMLVISDSGGFELLSRRSQGKSIDFTAEDVIKWEENNSNIGIILDHPPVKITTGGTGSSVTPLDYNAHIECAKETRANFEIMSNLRIKSSKDFYLYNVMQGGDFGKMDRWYKICFDGAEGRYEGVACAPKPSSNVFEVAKNLVYLYNKGHTKNIHTLGVAGKSTIPAIIYMYNYIDNLTYDSATYAQGRINNSFVEPFGMNFTQISNTYKERTIKELPCTCHVCQGLTPENVADDKLLPQIMTAHNLQIYIDYNKILGKALNNKEIFFKMAETFCPEIRTIAEFIDYAIEEKNVEKAVAKYENKGTFLTPQLKQGSVFDF